jgi:hypothetical protein
MIFSYYFIPLDKSWGGEQKLWLFLLLRLPLIYFFPEFPGQSSDEYNLR